MIAAVVAIGGFFLTMYGAMQLQGEFTRDLAIPRWAAVVALVSGLAIWIAGSLGLR